MLKSVQVALCPEPTTIFSKRDPITAICWSPTMHHTPYQTFYLHRFPILEILQNRRYKLHFSKEEIEFSDLSSISYGGTELGFEPGLCHFNVQGCFSSSPLPPTANIQASTLYCPVWVLLFLAVSGAVSPFLWVSLGAYQCTGPSWMSEIQAQCW